MPWKDLLQQEGETAVLPWVGGCEIRTKDRIWTLVGKNPQEQGWQTFKLAGRKAKWVQSSDPKPELLTLKVRGYLVGDHIVPDGAMVDPEPTRIHAVAERVHFIEPGLDRFVRVIAGRIYEGGLPQKFKPRYPRGLTWQNVAVAQW